MRKSKNEIPNLNIVNQLFEVHRPDKKYDLLLALHVLDHVDDPIESLTLLAEWLNESGTIVVLVPNKNSIHRILAKGMGLIKNLDDLSARDLQVGHRRVYDLESLKRDVSNAGFKVEAQSVFFLKPCQIR